MRREADNVDSRQRRRVLVFWLVIVASSMRIGATEIVLRASGRASGAFLVLGDVAEVRGADEATRERLRKMPLIPAPHAGETRRLRALEVLERLEMRGVETRSMGISGSNRIDVHGGNADDAAGSGAPRSAMKAVVVAARPLRRGDIVRRDDLMVRPAPASPASGQPLTDVDEAVGRELTRAAAAGQPIDSAFLRRPTLVRRNQPVRVIARIDGVRVATDGRAQSDGSEDDVVSIEMANDRTRIVTGRVIGMDEVEVFARGAFVSPSRRYPSPTDARVPESR
ncbi:MAG: flagellar basal body P-ring formation protein FlgA [Planctomycetes bacterium]|nr:flagellar basal body P-ring formation protein FlgA [Planctomycetota bacterium]